MKNEDILIIAIRYSVSKSGEYVHFNKLLDHINEVSGRGFPPSSTAIIHIFNQIIIVKGGESQTDNFGYLKIDAYYHLIEYDAMQSANVLARTALSGSNIAIGIAVAAIIIDVFNKYI